MSERSRQALVASLVALVAFLPFLRGALAGACLYFRDLSVQFFPLRGFALERLRAGEVAFWNPYTHEGVPLSLPAIGYPLVVLGLVRVLGGGGRRALAGTALALAVALATTGAEIVAQAVGVGLVLGMRRQPRAAWRAGVALALGTALAAPVLVLLAGQVEGSARGRGFTPEVVLAHSIHPFALVQTLVGSLFGNPADIANEWWGQNFFPRGFPYVLSLYLGACVLALALTGVVERRAPAGRLLLLVGVGLVLALGRFAGLTPVVEWLPAPLRAFRFPVKAFFSVHIALALLAALGLQALAQGRRWRTLAIAAGALGLLLAAAPLLPHAFPRPLAWFAAAFFPPGLAPGARVALVERILRDAATGGALSLLVGLMALAASRGRIADARAAWLVVWLVAADLLRTGAGLNPMVAPGFYEPSAELAARLPLLRQARVYTCPIETSPAFHAGLAAHSRDHELWSFGVLLETLSPFFNVPPRVATALSPDLTMLVPTERILSPEEGACSPLGPLLPRLREAGVSTLLSLDPLEHADLAPLFSITPARIRPVAIQAYALRDPAPPASLSGGGATFERRVSANRLELEIETRIPATLVVREAWAPGWTARVDGALVPMPRARHRQIAVPAGRHHVQFDYRPPGWLAALATQAAGLVVVAGLFLAGRR